MIKRLLILLIALTFCGKVFAQTKDQSWGAEHRNDGWIIRYNSTYFFQSQGFTAGVTDVLAYVVIMIGFDGTPNGDVWVEIRTDNGGEPSGSVITNGTSDKIACSTLTSGYVMRTFPFSTPPDLTSTTVYHIVFVGDSTVSESASPKWGIDLSGGYTGGILNLGTDASVWTAMTAQDCIFETWMGVAAVGGLVFVTEE